MDISRFKLHLINRLLQTDDPEVLLTVRRVLDLGKEGAPPTGDLPFDPERGATNADTEELQREIDDLFDANS